MPNLPALCDSRPIGGNGVATADFTDVLKSAVDYARAETSEGTRRAYASDWRAFEAWCASVAQQPLPASTAAVAGYLAHMADAGLKASTINRRAAAIAYRHRLANLTPPTGAESVKAVQRGIRRTIGTRVDRKAPATAKAIKAMVAAIPDTLAGRRDRALLLTGFAAALRRSELVALDVDDLERTPDGLFVHIRHSKTDQEGAGHIVAVPRGGRLRPVHAVEDWLEAAGITTGAVFRSIGKGGTLSGKRLSDRSVADIVKRWAAAAKLDPTLFAGHSLRAGFVTSALEAGADPLKVMDVTRHSQVQTLKGYDRRAKAFKDHAGKGFL